MFSWKLTTPAPYRQSSPSSAPLTPGELRLGCCLLFVVGVFMLLGGLLQRALLLLVLMLLLVADW